MNWGKCAICGHRGWMTHHVCSPIWECVNADAVSYADEEDVWRKIYANDAEQAAEKFAEQEDEWSAEYPAEQGVAVRDSDGKIDIYDVMLESMPVYTASKKAEDK